MFPEIKTQAREQYESRENCIAVRQDSLLRPRRILRSAPVLRLYDAISTK